MVVSCDLALSLIIWLGLLALRTYHKMVDNDINTGTLNATHFSVVMAIFVAKDYYNAID